MYGATDPTRAPALPAARGILLKNGSYHGTLAAARDLGRQGVPVVLMELQPDTPTAHSRYVTRTERSPGLDDLNAYADWLIRFGRSNPGYVLYPTSDDLLWIMDTHRDALATCFHLFQPPAGALYELLNKKRLFQHCQRLGIDHPRTWLPQPGDDLAALAQSLPYPVLLKPQMQAGLRVQTKGAPCHNAAEFLQLWARSDRLFSYKDAVVQRDPQVGQLMVQQFHPEAASQIYSLAGFFDPGHDILLVRAAQKLLQQPVTIGVGLCFEGRAVHARPLAQLQQLMSAVGYHGAFEAEFIHLPQEDRFLLIDLNTRFYGQMGFEIARNLPIARLCYHAAAGEQPQLLDLARTSVSPNDAPADWKCCIRHMLSLLVTTLALGGQMRWAERRRWLRWARTGHVVDPIAAPDDAGPARSYWRGILRNLLRHPRSSLRRFFRA